MIQTSTRCVKPATPRQAQVLRYIVAHIVHKGYPPTVREIVLHLGVTSTNGVNDHLVALERKGYIRRDPRTARGICVLRPNRRRQMIKYGVVTKEKIRCPLCKKKLDTSTTPPTCPKCGTRGIEEQPEDEESQDEDHR